MKTMCPPGYHHNGFVAIHALVATTYITVLALLVEHSLVHWYQQCVTVHRVPKCMSCYKAIVVITGRAHCFRDYIYIYYTRLASVRFEHSVCRGSIMTTYITLLALLVEHSLVHWYQQCVTVHRVPKCIKGYLLKLLSSH